MVRSSSLALVFACVLSACSHVVGAKVTGSGVKGSATRALAPFTEIRATGAFRLEVRSGAADSAVVVEGDDNLVPLFVTDVANQTLSLNLPSGSFAPKVPLVVRVSAPSVTSLGANGAISATIEGVSGPEFDARLSGACNLRAQGTADHARYAGTGACDLEAFDLVAGACELVLSGASSARVHATRRLEAESNGACTVRYRGKPEVASTVSGSSTIQPDDSH
ncbi:MAG: DUF2807 domain-containing protein [Planctomycetota bacterium]|nr:DUF2807 domain-containing protein [Planctomycetota bacterium]